MEKLSIAASIEDKKFIVHCGLSPELKTIEQLQKIMIMRFTDFTEKGFDIK